MSNIVARIGIYGDLHLSSKAYGAHRDYPKESLQYLRDITELTEKLGFTHLIGLGDLTYGRFHTLEYRNAVDAELSKQYALVKGNRYELFGNHDEASFGMTERDYYISKGLLKPSSALTIGNLHITMVDNGKYKTTTPNIVDSEDCINVILAHDYFKFNNSQTADFGKFIPLDNMESWFGADCLICGHIHKIMNFEGYITRNNTEVHKLQVYYPGCMMRPAYREGYMDDIGQVIYLTLFDDGKMDIDTAQMQLWSLSDSFNLEEKEKEKATEAEKRNRVDISEVVKQLDMHDRNVGNPEDIIASLDGIDERYKSKAIELLKSALG